MKPDFQTIRLTHGLIRTVTLSGLLLSTSGLARTAFAADAIAPLNPVDTPFASTPSLDIMAQVEGFTQPDVATDMDVNITTTDVDSSNAVTEQTVPETTAPETAPEAAPDASAPATLTTTPESPSVPSAEIPADSNSPAPEAAPAGSAIEILSPAPDAVLDVPSAAVTVRYPLDTEVELRVNGQLVGSELVGRTATDTETQQITRTWYGVVLRPGTNELTVTTVGSETVLAQTSVMVRGVPVQMRLTPQATRIPADGRSTVIIEGVLLDDQGNPSSHDGVVTLIPSAGQFVGADANPDQPEFQVETQHGQFTATLQSSLAAGAVRIRAVNSDLEAYTQLSFETELRPTVMTGVLDFRLGARGTNYFGSRRDFLPLDGDNGTELNVTGAVFGITSIGDWRFTGAYRSDRALNENCDGTTSLFRTEQPCDRNYPVYGDDSTSEILAPSTDSLYLRLERTSPVSNAGLDYFMWGDYRTDTEFARPSQLFTSVSRTLHGFSGNYNFGNLQITGIYGNNVEGFQRDAIAPDGTSGFYFLSRRLLIPGSEAVYLELEAFNRPGQVIERQRLSRGSDYEIDYDRGTLLFRRPILRTAVDSQGQTLVRRIITTYNYEGGENTSLYGGRLQYHLSRDLGRESWIGATYLQENHGTQRFELYGADAQFSFGQDGLLIAEYAHSDNGLDSRNSVTGEAMRLEVSSSLTENLSGRAYWQQVSEGFANNATTSFVPGQRRYGAELQASVTETTTLRLSYDHEDNYGVAPQRLDALVDLLNPGTTAAPGQPVDNSLTTITAGIQQRVGSATTSFDWVHRDRVDRLRPEFTRSSDQIRSLLNLPLSETLSFTALNELNLSSESDPLYPNRTLLGLNWQLSPGISLGVTHQILNGGEFEDDSITTLYLAGEYNLGPETLLRGNFSLFDSGQIAGSVGIQQGIVLAPGLRIDMAYEHVFQNNNLITGSGTQFAQPYAVGQSTAALGLTGGDSYSVGISYTDDPNFQASARWEHRTSPSGSNTVITANALGQITPSLTALVRYQQASAANQLLEGLGDTTNLRIGLAYRNPNDDTFNALLRYEYRSNPGIVPETLFLGSGTGSRDHVFSAEAIYAPSWQWEFYGKYALRHSTSYLATDLVGSSTVSLAQLRATYRPGYRWDIVGEARWISQPSTGFSETGFALEGGYYLTPNIRLSAGYSFGQARDRDFHGSRSAGGPYLGVTLKLDHSLLEGFGVESLQESTASDSASSPSTPPTLVPVATRPSAPGP